VSHAGSALGRSNSGGALVGQRTAVENRMAYKGVPPVVDHQLVQPIGAEQSESGAARYGRKDK
jgi:hypothetical protein